jgi:amino acid adenylation domain-containing protein
MDTMGGPTPTVHTVFEAHVDRAPHAIALIAGPSRITYRDLDERANRLAHRLRAAGVGPEVPVAFLLERDEMPVIAILAIMKAGGCYVPIEPSYPADRRAHIVGDSRALVAITTRDAAASFNGVPTVIYVDDDLSTFPATRPDVDVDADNLAYIIYTSGSTGKPKGSLVTHRNLLRLMRSTEHWFHFGPDDCWTVFHSFAFDFSVWELWGALLYGGRAVVVPHLVSRSPADMLDLIVAERVTVLDQTPSAFRQLMHAVTSNPARWPNLPLRYVIFGGEALDIPALAPWFEQYGDRQPQLVNMYGITETTVHVTYRPVTRADTGSPQSVIGEPIPDLTVHVLDDALQPVATNAEGELFVGGAGLSRGYLRLSSLTAQRFIPDPFASAPGARLYRSGDRGRRLASGDIEYIGRQDFQVKIRGFRIELGEIEAALRSHPDVRDVVVIAREDTPGDKRLAAYVIARDPAAPPNNEQLREQVRRLLPDYMVPSAFVMCDAFPLTTNGKLDRAALPVPGAPPTTQSPSDEGPSSTLEVWLATTWAELLGIEAVGLDDDFFELGGHSLLLMQLIVRIDSELGLETPLRALFEATTVRTLAAAMADQWAEAEAMRAEIEAMSPDEVAALLAKDE